jgi:molybdopterin synthase sulfur carrier subunit
VFPESLLAESKADYMPITVKFFASLREQHGADRQLPVPEQPATVADVWARASRGEALPDNVLMAVNLEYVAADHPVEDGDEVAFFPPVTGG